MAPRNFAECACLALFTGERPPATCEIVAQGDGNHYEEPDHASRQYDANQFRVIKRVHEDGCDQGCLEHGNGYSCDKTKLPNRVE